MEIILSKDMFVNDKYSVQYGNREAMFTIIDEEFSGLNNLARVNRITVLVREFDNNGVEKGAVLCTTVIGLGDGIVGVKSDVPALRGKLLTQDNMEQCVVELHEDE
jgi:hypothetical protein